MIEERVCPNCYSKLKKNNRNLGGGSIKWMICPNCGLREKEDSVTFNVPIVGHKRLELNKYIKYVTWELDQENIEY